MDSRQTQKIYRPEKEKGEKRSMFFPMLLLLAIALVIAANWDLLNNRYSDNFSIRDTSSNVVAEKVIPVAVRKSDSLSSLLPEVVVPPVKDSISVLQRKQPVIPAERKISLAKMTEPDISLDSEYLRIADQLTKPGDYPKIAVTEWDEERDGNVTTKRSRGTYMVEAFEQDGKIGFRSQKEFGDKIFVKPQYEQFRFYVQETSRGVAVVRKDNKWGIIDMKNDILIPFIYDRVDHWGSTEYWLVLKDGKYGVLRSPGMTAALPVEYDFISDLHNTGLIRVRRDGKYGFVDRENKLIIPIEYDFASDDYTLYAHVRKNGDNADYVFDSRGRRLSEGDTRAVLKSMSERRKK